MKTTTHAVWTATTAGVLVPNGSIVEGEDRSTTTIHHVKDSAIAIEAVFAQFGVAIPPVSDLQRMIDKVKAMSDGRLTNNLEGISNLDFYDNLHVARLADAILPLADFDDARPYLRRLTSGSLDFFVREPSPAKDTFWELELWALLRRQNAATSLKDPPDIVLALDRGDLGIACKKVYSEKNVEKVLSRAVKQVSGFDVAVVALNIDDTLPAASLLPAKTEAQMTAKLRAIGDDFLARHERHLRKYLSAQRLVGAVITCNVVVAVEEWQVHYNNARQSTVWCFPGLDSEARSRVRELERLIVG